MTLFLFRNLRRDTDPMKAELGRHGPLPEVLRGRERERGVLAGAVAAARAGRGGAVLVVGTPGTGRSALLAEAVRAASGFTVYEVSGVEPEARLPLAGLHRLLSPLARRIRQLPEPHAEALAEVLAGRMPSAGDLGVGVALHQLLVSLCDAGPLAWQVDDAQWLDAASLRALGFVARRLAGLPAVVLLSTDAGCRAVAALDGVETVGLGALDPVTAARVLADRGRGSLPPDLLGELVDLAEGNPLALVELAATVGARPTDGPLALPPSSRLLTRYRRRLQGLSHEARALVSLVLVGEGLAVGTLAEAARRAGLAPRAWDEAWAAGLVATGEGVATVPGRLIRGGLYADLPLADRQTAHEVLAAVLDPDSSGLSRALHRLAAAGRPTRELVADLEGAAAAARESGDHAAAASALERAAEVTARPETRARWLAAASADALLAGEFHRSRGLLRRVLPRCASAATRSLRTLVKGEIELRGGVPAVACRELSSAVDGCASSPRELTVRMLMLAGEASDLAGDFTSYFTLADRARHMRRADDPPELQLIFDHFAGMAATFQGRHDEANRALRRVVRLAGSVRDPESAIWASQAAYTLGDAQRAHQLAVAAVCDARERGAVSLVSGALVYQALSALMLDRYAAAEAGALEGLRLAERAGQRNRVVDHLAILALLAALQGDGETATVRLKAAAHDVAVRELGRPGAFNCWSFACIDLVENRPADAFGRFGHMAAGAGQINLAIRGMAAPHFVEAAVRCGQRGKAAGALRAFESWAAAGGSTTRLALAQRCHGLLAEGDADADEHFREALRLHRDDNAALEMAKTELFYAHRLRRSRKPGEARGLLRDALRVFQQFEAQPWVDRATAELRASGDSAGPAARHAGQELTGQQARISGLVAQGATNREIADLLVLSPRTVEYHLRNIFARLGVRSRVELASLFW